MSKKDIDTHGHSMQAAPVPYGEGTLFTGFDQTPLLEEPTPPQLNSSELVSLSDRERFKISKSGPAEYPAGQYGYNPGGAVSNPDGTGTLVPRHIYDLQTGDIWALPKEAYMVDTRPRFGREDYGVRSGAIYVFLPGEGVATQEKRANGSPKFFVMPRKRDKQRAAASTMRSLLVEREKSEIMGRKNRVQKNLGNAGLERTLSKE